MHATDGGVSGTVVLDGAMNYALAPNGISPLKWAHHRERPRPAGSDVSRDVRNAPAAFASTREVPEPVHPPDARLVTDPRHLVARIRAVRGAGPERAARGGSRAHRRSRH